jgi:flagellar motility protein MotE (MotC chaperone)
MDVGQMVGSQPQLVSAALVLSGVMLILQGVGQAIQIWKNTRRHPPLDQELQFYAKKADVAMMEQRLRDEIADRAQRQERVMEKHQEEQAKAIDNIFARINSSQKAVEETFRQIMHELGKLTGRTEKKG